jgi:hypothetical protein
MDAIAARSVEDRLEEWAALNQAVAQMEADAVRRRHPECSDRQVFLALVRKRYGNDLVGGAWPDEPLVDA